MADNNFFSRLMETGEFRISDDGLIQLLNEYMFFLPSPVAAKLQSIIVKKHGADEAEKIFTEMGAYQVEQAAKRYEDDYNFEEMSTEKINEFTSQIIRLIGFGDVEFKQLDPEDGAVVELEKSVFASRYRDIEGQVTYPADFWFKGLIERHFEVIFDAEVSVEERECVAKGDERCLFVVSFQ